MRKTLLGRLMTRRTWLKRSVFVAAMLPWVWAWGGEKPSLTQRGPASERSSLLTQAIRERKVIVFVYNGHERRVEPHALGRANDEKPALLAWQTAGGSRSEPPPGWRLFLVNEIETLSVTAKTFEKPRADYSAKGRGLKSVEVDVTQSAATEPAQ
ncbi:MAG: WYL domain-containing protein [Rariglobus sp.]